MQRILSALLLALLLVSSLQDRAWAASTPPEKTASGSPGENPNKHATFNPVLTIQLQRDAAMWGEGTVLDVDVGPNLYAYVRQNPWTKFDPLGLMEPLSNAMYSMVEQAVGVGGVVTTDTPGFVVPQAGIFDRFDRDMAVNLAMAIANAQGQPFPVAAPPLRGRALPTRPSPAPKKTGNSPASQTNPSQNQNSGNRRSGDKDPSGGTTTTVQNKNTNNGQVQKPTPEPKNTGRRNVTRVAKSRKEAKEMRPKPKPAKPGKPRVTRQKRNQKGEGNKMKTDHGKQTLHFHDRNHNNSKKDNVHYRLKKKTYKANKSTSTEN